MEGLSWRVAADKFQLHKTKCKEVHFSFSYFDVIFDPILINDKELECVDDAKILRLCISNKL